MIAIIVLFIVFLLIAIRKIGRLRLQIWQIMLFGALAVMITGQISIPNALRAIKLDVIMFLFGMFIIGRALEDSGYLSHLSYKLFRKAKKPDHLLFLIIFVMGIAAAFLMNDTMAIIGTPVVLQLAKKHNINPKMLLLALAFSITIGSVMSPIGNPQNLLIALSGGIENPFVTFFRYLFLPTVINLVACYFILKLFYKTPDKRSAQIDEPLKKPRLANLSKISLILLIILIVTKILIVIFQINFDFRLTYIALIAAIPVLIHKERLDIIKRIDWSTLIFFAAMFVLMAAVWDSGFFQSIISGYNISSIIAILVISILLSQLISNVPLVALYMPMLLQADAHAKGLVALAAGSTIAGNLFILGAASNIIIIQNAEKQTGDTLTFMDFAKIGVPLTILNALVYWIFLL